MDTPEKNSILIIDDEEMNLRMLTGFLGGDYAIRTAQSGSDGIKMALDDQPDLILLDVLMPEMDGYEVLSKLKQNDKTRKIPVIFITGLDSKEDEEKGLAMDAADYISKPFSVGIVKLRVKNQMQIVNQIRTIESLSLIDQLTGIPNRRCLDNRFVMEWGRAFREQSPLSLMMMDIDKFKIFNDTYGHLLGDEVLKTVAASFEHSLKRKSDFAARFGGEEFSILIPGIDIDGAICIAEDVRKGVEALVIPCGNGETTYVTISVGVHSIIPTAKDTIADMIAKADQALYTAKETGRNKVCAYDESMAGKVAAKKKDEKASKPVDEKSAHITASTPSVVKKEVQKPKEIIEDAVSYSGLMEEIKKVDGVNVEAGIRHFHGMERMYIDTLSFFCKRIPKLCGDMDNYLNSGDIEKFAITVHSVKSMLSTIGAIGLSDMAANLETAGKSRDEDYCQKNYPGFQQKLLSMNGRLSAVFPKDDGEKKVKQRGDAAFLREAVAKALNAAEAFDSDEASIAIKDALLFDFGEEINALLESALDRLTEYDFPGLTEILNKDAFKK